MRKRYWMGPIGEADEFNDPYTDLMYDAKTTMGPWANMTPKSWRRYGFGRLGPGLGQLYKRQVDGRWLKIEG